MRTNIRIAAVATLVLPSLFRATRIAEKAASSKSGEEH